MRAVLFLSDIFKSLNDESFVLVDREQNSILWTSLISCSTLGALLGGNTSEKLIKK